MKLTLMIEGSAAVIAAVLAGLPDGANADPAPSPPMRGATTNLVHADEAAFTTMPAGSAPQGMNQMGAMLPTMPAMQPLSMTSGDDEDEGTPSTAEKDNTGLPWDERIHSGGRAMTVKGVWKKRKSVDAALVTQVEAELRGNAPVMQMPVMAPIPAAGGMPGMPAAAPAPAAGPTFPEFMQTLSAQMTAGKISTEQVAWVASTLGLNAITDLGLQPEKLSQAIDLFRTNGLWV